VSAASAAKAVIGPRLTVLARCVLRGLPRARWGNLRRVEPFSRAFGSDRGTPVDRFYLHAFLDANRSLITGRVLEVQLPSYTGRYGHDVVTSDTVDINPEFRPTYICDLADARHIPSDSYDCVLAPQTLQHVEDLNGVLRTMMRIVKPGGWILASAPTLLPLIADGDEYWHLTPAAWRLTLAREWRGCDVSVEGHGNCLAAIAAMQGLALEELTEDELNVNDPRYPVLVTIKGRRN
jgi:SAM-dependent methyltransferase